MFETDETDIFEYNLWNEEDWDLSEFYYAIETKPKTKYLKMCAHQMPQQNRHNLCSKV